MQDEIKTDSASTIQHLVSYGIKPVMLTGIIVKMQLMQHENLA